MTNVAMSLLRDRILALQAADAGLREEVSRLQHEGVNQSEQLAAANQSLQVAREGSLLGRPPTVLTCLNEPPQAGSASTPQLVSDGSLHGRPPTVSTSLTDPSGPSSLVPPAARGPGVDPIDCIKCPKHLIQIRDLNVKDQKTI